ncbi:hypothetical protein E0Z10_g5851 [Xylaria hypoxylon]|uniref:glutamine--tRNA ligase n=1 Tax=Xylaria hypoxylon TaxID=37992 RepID=A0A4Z0YF22_9PEZI|nr:hypothetical protein E0Z10_g5851 [Xylaria hypoxylon]
MAVTITESTAKLQLDEETGEMVSNNELKKRFNDTNPDAEKEGYFVAIKDTIQRLGFTPAEITYAFDNFQRLYDLSEELVKLEKAYVCHYNEPETKIQRGVDSKDYFRVALGKTVGLLYIPYHTKAVSFTTDNASGVVKEIQTVFDKDTKKPKAYIQWVLEGSPAAEVRIHTSLFKSEQPLSAPGGFINNLTPNRETICPKRYDRSQLPRGTPSSNVA